VDTFLNLWIITCLSDNYFLLWVYIEISVTVKKNLYIDSA